MVIYIFLDNICETIYPKSIVIIEGPPLVNFFEIFKEKVFSIFLSQDQKLRANKIRANNFYDKIYKSPKSIGKYLLKMDESLINNYLKNADLEIK